jgi:electron transport complex protein RnfG
MSDEAPKAPNKGGYLGQAWLVILLALVYGAALAGVQTTLGPMIAENKRNETYDVIPSLVPGAVRDNTVERKVTGGDGKQRTVYEARDAEKKLVGWVVPADGQGFADRIDLLVGLDARAETITGLYVLDQKETPGLGNLIVEEPFGSQFVGKPTATPLEVDKSETQESHQIRAVTGATISSESVAGIVNGAVATLKKPLREAADGR